MNSHSSCILNLTRTGRDGVVLRDGGYVAIHVPQLFICTNELGCGRCGCELVELCGKHIPMNSQQTTFMAQVLDSSSKHHQTTTKVNEAPKL